MKQVQKSMIGVALLSVSMAVSFEEHKTHLISQQPEAHAITLPASIVGGSQRVVLPALPFEQDAPQLAQIIELTGNEAIKKALISLFEEQNRDGLAAWNSEAKQALEAAASNGSQQETVAFTQRLRHGLQQKHEREREDLVQARQQHIEQAGNMSGRVVRVAGVAVCYSVFCGAAIILLAQADGCHS